ncbi:MAG: Required for respiratory growth protein 9 mitochondrial [Cirrosporium novae-zelandiae]|nr:MAG: Required for respiratory growth protein 9 mitochondrial [Cirrosporium novae-zelandiae]
MPCTSCARSILTTFVNSLHPIEPLPLRISCASRRNILLQASARRQLSTSSEPQTITKHDHKSDDPYIPFSESPSEPAEPSSNVDGKAVQTTSNWASRSNGPSLPFDFPSLSSIASSTTSPSDMEAMDSDLGPIRRGPRVRGDLDITIPSTIIEDKEFRNSVEKLFGFPPTIAKTNKENTSSVTSKDPEKKKKRSVTAKAPGKKHIRVKAKTKAKTESDAKELEDLDQEPEQSQTPVKARLKAKNLKKLEEEPKQPRIPAKKTSPSPSGLDDQTDNLDLHKSSDKEADQPTWGIQKAALKRKFPEGYNPLKRLSPDTLTGIRALHGQYPERFPTPTLSKLFKISPEGIRRILKSNWAPTEEEDKDRKQRWVKRGERIWDRWVELGVRPPKKGKGTGKVIARPKKTPWKGGAERRQEAILRALGEDN